MKKLLFYLTPAVLVVLTACGGNQGTKVTVTAETYGGSPALIAAAAYQIGNGDWQVLSPDKDGDFVFYVPGGEKRYGVAIRCGGMIALGNFAVSAVYQLTTDESTSPLLSCLTMGQVVGVSGEVDVGGVGGATDYGMFATIDNDEDSVDASTHKADYSLNLTAGTSRDFVAAAMDNLGAILAAKIVRGVNATSTVGGLNVSLSLPGDALVTHTLQPFSVPSGWNGSYDVSLVTAGGASVGSESLGNSGSTTGGGVIHGVANAGHGDLYIARIMADPPSDNQGVVHWEMIDAPNLGDPNLALNIAPFPAGYAVTAAAHPEFPANHPDAGVSQYAFFTISAPADVWSYYVSTAWLGNAGSYATPDLSSVYGFADTYPVKGEKVQWFSAAIKTNGSPQEFFELPHRYEWFMALPEKAGLKLDAALYKGDFTQP